MWRQDGDHLILGVLLGLLVQDQDDRSQPPLLRSHASSRVAFKWLRIRDQIVDTIPALLVGVEVNTYVPKELHHLEIGVSFIVCSSVIRRIQYEQRMDMMWENCSRLFYNWCGSCGHLMS